MKEPSKFNKQRVGYKKRRGAEPNPRKNINKIKVRETKSIVDKISPNLYWWCLPPSEFMEM